MGRNPIVVTVSGWSNVGKIRSKLYLETQLIGPAAGEEVVETLTYPFLVVRCGRTELLCRIES